MAIRKNKHIYRVKYGLQLSAGKFRSDEKLTEDQGLTDAGIFFSILYPADGSLSINFDTFDGRSGELRPLHDAELFKVWMLVATKLGTSTELDEPRRKFIEAAVDTFISGVRANAVLN